MIIPHTSRDPLVPAAADTRAASLFKTNPDGCQIALLGLPDDLGVRMNNGRLGASLGPRAIRTQLSRFGVATPHGFNWPSIADMGDITPVRPTDVGLSQWPDGPFDSWPTSTQQLAAQALEQTHARITEAVTAILKLGLLPISLGGGHDLTYPFARAVLKHHAVPVFRGIYFDAHLDVRDTLGSGMPFRRLLTEFPIQTLELRGYSPLVNTREHTAWFLDNHGVLAQNDTPVVTKNHTPRFASFDLDVIDASAAPGVSALNPAGITTTQAAAWVRELGSDPTTICFDIMELNPRHDDPPTATDPGIAGRTARVAAMLLLEFCAGFAERSQ